MPQDPEASSRTRQKGDLFRRLIMVALNDFNAVDGYDRIGGDVPTRRAEQIAHLDSCLPFGHLWAGVGLSAKVSARFSVVVSIILDSSLPD